LFTANNQEISKYCLGQCWKTFNIYYRANHKIISMQVQHILYLAQPPFKKC
jgi:hypothetical protein